VPAHHATHSPLAGASVPSARRRQGQSAAVVCYRHSLPMATMRQ
jgi:hypothetical protein